MVAIRGAAEVCDEQDRHGEKRAAQGPYRRSFDAETGNAQPAQSENPGQGHVHEYAEEAGHHDGPRLAQADEVAGQHALREKNEGPEHEDAEEAELQSDQVRAVSCPAEPQVHEGDQGKEHRIEDHGQEEPLGNSLDAALGPARAVVLGSQRVHVPDDPPEKGGEDELRQAAAHGGRDVVGAEKRDKVPVEEEHDCFRALGNHQGERDGEHVPEGYLAVQRRHGVLSVERSAGPPASAILPCPGSSLTPPPFPARPGPRGSSA